MLLEETKHLWEEFISFMKEKCSVAEYQNWLAPISVIDGDERGVTLQVPNVFVGDYLLENYKKELASFLPCDNQKNPIITFVIAEPKKAKTEKPSSLPQTILTPSYEPRQSVRLNRSYTFSDFIEGPSNQFVKSAALGIAKRPGQSYNPLFIHGGVGLGKTHLLHSIGHEIKSTHKKLRVQCITTEAFINDLVDNLRSKTVDKMETLLS